MDLLARKFWASEKRFLLLLLMVLVCALAVWRWSPEVNSDQKLAPKEQRLSLSDATSKLKPGSDWKPVGYGSGQYLETIPKIRAGAVIDLVSGEVIWSMNLKERVAPASLAKVATVMTALDIADTSEIIKISDDAASQIPTKLGLVEGEKLTLEEAVAAAILTSANDATEAIADSLGEEFGGDSATFMELVNKKLAAIGAMDSHFETATGLDSDGHYSTVYDLALIAHEVKNYELIAEVASLGYKKLPPDGNHRLIDLPNWNALLGTYPGVNGLKIGYTEAAGHVTMVTAEREDKKLVAIVIGAKSLEEREIAAATLLNYGFEKKGLEAYPIASLDLVSRFEDWRRQLSQGGP